MSQRYKHVIDPLIEHLMHALPVVLKQPSFAKLQWPMPVSHKMHAGKDFI